MEKSYIVNLKFGSTQWQVWFSGEDNQEAENKWKNALMTLESVGDECADPQEFLQKAVEHFKKSGFIRIMK